MIRATGRYHNQKLELDQPLNLEEGARVVIEIQPTSESIEQADWQANAMDRLEEEWDNPDDALYDNWKQLYDIDPR